MTLPTLPAKTRLLTTCLIVSVLVSIHQYTHSATVPAFSIQQDEETKEKKKKETEKKRPEEKEEEKGKLGSFEEEATEEDKTMPTYSHTSTESSGGWAFAGNLFYAAFKVGGVASWARVRGYSGNEEYNRYWGPRQTGEPVIPFVKLNAGYQNVESDVEAFDGAIEGGYGPVGIRYRRTHYREKDPDTELDLSQVHFLYRMSYTKSIELDIGLGAVTVDGVDRNSGFSFALPFRFYVGKLFGLSFRPSWGTINDQSISDYDLGLSIGIRYVGVKGGYRWLKAGSATLNGPFFGLQLYY